MSAPIPCLGYPSRTAAVLALTSEGLSDGQIARRTGISKKNVLALAYSGARRRSPRLSELTGRTVVIPRDVLKSLVPHAAKRGLSVNALVRLIIETVADDEMVDSVLDDLEIAA